MKILVLDVGGSSIKYAVMNQEAEFFDKGKIPTPLDKIENFVDSIGAIYDKYRDIISGIAISMPGRIDSDRGYAYTGGSLQYNGGKNIVEILQERCPLPIFIENDGKCAALAEACAGNLSDSNDGIVVIIGTGIGGGIIKDKKLHKGANFIAGEFSFVKTISGSISNTLTSIWGLTCGVGTLIREVADKKGLSKDEVDGIKVFEYVNNGDEEVLKLLDDYTYRIAEQLFNLQYMYDPEKIAIGGGISAQEILLEYIQKNIKKIDEELPYDFPCPTVVRCKFMNDSNLIGALHVYLKKMENINA